MKINTYRFGYIEVDGRDYRTDLIVHSDRIETNWCRKQGHELAIEDVQTIVAEQPEVLVIGTGCYGRMHIPQSTLDYFSQQGIKVESARTSAAVERFNQLQQECARVVAALHLTC